MSTHEGMFETEIYPTDHGLLAVRQENVVLLLSADQVLTVIRELRAYYDTRAQWQEPTER